ncbi:Ceramidase [Zostera marina]|uniref:Ceramidase n=1 Tax=Zostera marina TaxID=29655 RepID=A0A0K9P6P7_ZOSMR|nr:Ceramidase [Zostera marina]
MAGRRLRDAVKAVLSGENGGEFNSNLHGASTLFGPYTLDGYIQEFKRLASSMLNEQSIPSGPQPPDLLDKQIELLPGVVLDTPPLDKNFDDISSDIPKNSSFKRGDMVVATFFLVSLCQGTIS